VERVSDRERVGIFGGTFDPPHIGHLILAAEARQQLDLDFVYFVLAADPPHKQDRKITPIDHRLQMLELALTNQDYFKISRVEIDRPGPHFALDSIKQFQKELPDSDLIYLIGGDSLRDLPTWHQPSKLVARINRIGVMRRPFTDLDLTSLTKKIPELEKKLEFINTPLLEISSREIRKKVVEGGHYRNYLPTDVYSYILANQLYLS
jgi:nicotinate-nucleotide adenylyltransferase